MTIDQLAAEVGVTTRTIRSYQARRLIHPPHRIGRTPYYTDRHLGRIRLVQSLQHKGMSLDAIGALLEPDHLLSQFVLPDRTIARTLQERPQLANALVACGVLIRLPDGVLRIRCARAVLAAIALRRPGVSTADALSAIVDATNTTAPRAAPILAELVLALRDRLQAGEDDQDWIHDLVIPVLELAMSAAVRAQGATAEPT